MTLAEKILAAHCGRKKVVPGELVNVKVDLVLANDITAPIAIKEFRRIGVKRVFDPKKIVMVPDHFVPNKDILSAEQAKLMRDFALEQGLIYFEVGQMGIEHVILPEKGLVLPGGAEGHEVRSRPTAGVHPAHVRGQAAESAEPLQRELLHLVVGRQRLPLGGDRHGPRRHDGGNRGRAARDPAPRPGRRQPLAVADDEAHVLLDRGVGTDPVLRSRPGQRCLPVVRPLPAPGRRRVRGVFAGEHLRPRTVVAVVTRGIRQEPRRRLVVVLVHEIGLGYFPQHLALREDQADAAAPGDPYICHRGLARAVYHTSHHGNRQRPRRRIGLQPRPDLPRYFAQVNRAPPTRRKCHWRGRPG